MEMDWEVLCDADEFGHDAPLMGFSEGAFAAPETARHIFSFPQSRMLMSAMLGGGWWVLPGFAQPTVASSAWSMSHMK